MSAILRPQVFNRRWETFKQLSIFVIDNHLQIVRKAATSPGQALLEIGAAAYFQRITVISDDESGSLPLINDWTFG